MFLGKYTRKIGKRSRTLSIPPSLAGKLGDWIVLVTTETSRYLELYPLEDPRKLLGEHEWLLECRNRKITIPNVLYQQVEWLKKELLVVGNEDHAEIWGKEQYRKELKETIERVKYLKGMDREIGVTLLRVLEISPKELEG